MGLGLRLLYALIAGACLAAAFPPWGVPFLIPIGLATLALALTDADKRAAFYVGVLAGAVYLGGTQFWLFSVFGTPAVSLIALIAAFTVLFCCLLPRVIHTFPRIPLPLLAATLWVGIEHYRAEWFALNFGWGALGYSVAGRPAFAQLASMVGVYGISWLLVALAVICRKDWRKVLALTVIWTALCLYNPTPPAPENPLKVRLVQAVLNEKFFFEKTKSAASAQLVVWPEYAFKEDPTRRHWPKIQEAARTSGAYLVFGGEDYQGHRSDEVFKNTAFVVSPQGELVGKHVKNHTVHLINDGIKGTEANAIQTDLGKLGVGICFDMDYTDVARRLTASGAEVLIIPNMDPAEWGPVQQAGHRLLFAMRAMENGRWLARADVEGGTSVNAPTGQVTARVPTGDEFALDTEVGRRTSLSLYTRFGWVFGPLSTWLAAGLVLPGAMQSLRRRRGASPGTASRSDAPPSEA